MVDGNDSEDKIRLPSWTGPNEHHDVEGNPLVKVAVLHGDGHHDAGNEHHVRLLQVLLPHGVRRHDSYYIVYVQDNRVQDD